MKQETMKGAGAKLSALIAAAEHGESTTITERGKPAAVLVRADDAMKLSPTSPKSFADHLLAFPGGIEFARDETPIQGLDP